MPPFLPGGVEAGDSTAARAPGVAGGEFDTGGDGVVAGGDADLRSGSGAAPAAAGTGAGDAAAGLRSVSETLPPLSARSLAPPPAAAEGLAPAAAKRMAVDAVSPRRSTGMARGGRPLTLARGEMSCSCGCGTRVGEPPAAGVGIPPPAAAAAAATSSRYEEEVRAGSTGKSAGAGTVTNKALVPVPTEEGAAAAGGSAGCGDGGADASTANEPTKGCCCAGVLWPASAAAVAPCGVFRPTPRRTKPGDMAVDGGAGAGTPARPLDACDLPECADRAEDPDAFEDARGRVGVTVGEAAAAAPDLCPAAPAGEAAAESSRAGACSW